ncbi:MAG: glycosyltransferase family 39 protein [Verrucomicrobiae bacterium]|nr:glycosyltransferase family 39 protein [Verrucomicrobiae bacterium]
MKISFPTGYKQSMATWIPSPLIGSLLLLWLAGALAILIHADPPASVADKMAAALAAQQLPNWKLVTVVGIYWGAVAHVTIVAAAFLTMRWWCRRQNGNSAVAQLAVAPPNRSFIAILIVVVLAAGALRWRLANGSLWWDEMWNVKMATIGEFRTSSKHPDELRFYPTDFARCAWYYQKPTNHVPTALASKVCHLLWAKATSAADGKFSEFIVRLPVFLSALGSVILIGLCVRSWIGSGVGLWAAALLAVHPWFIRYGIDARAYGPVVFFTLLSLWSLNGAITGDRYRHWAIFGFAQFMLMWSHLHSIWFCASTTLAAGTFIWLNSPPTARLPKLGRLFAANALAGAVFLQVFLPNIIQLSHWHSNSVDGSIVNFDMAQRLLSLILFGMEPDWAAAGIETAGLPSWGQLTNGSLWLMWMAILAAIAVMITGAVRLWHSSRTAAILVLSLFFGGLAFVCVAYALDLYFYPRFMISILPPVVITLAIGFWCCGSWIADKILPGKSCLFTAIGIAAYVFVCVPQIMVLQRRSYAPMREVARFLQDEERANGAIMTLGYGLGSRILTVYYPTVGYTLDAPGDDALKAAMARAIEEKNPLYVFYGYPAFNRMVLPKGFGLLEDPLLFEEVAAFPGIEPEFYFRILKAKTKQAIPH